MTTIIGIKTNSGVEGIVLGADTQLSSIENGALTQKKTASKIVYGKEWVIGHAGLVDNEVYQFFQVLSSQKKLVSLENTPNEIILRAVKRHDDYVKDQKIRDIHFQEVIMLNAKMMRRDESELDNLSKFVLSVYQTTSGLRLFEIDEFGNLKEPKKDSDIEYTIIGSGEQIAERYIKRLIDEDEAPQFLITIPRAIDIVWKGLKEAQRDPYTNGPIDLVVLTKEGVIPYGKEIRDALISAETQKITTIKKKYEQEN